MGEQSVFYVAVELDGMFAENVDEGEDVGGVFTLLGSTQFEDAYVIALRKVLSPFFFVSDDSTL